MGQVCEIRKDMQAAKHFLHQ